MTRGSIGGPGSFSGGGSFSGAWSPLTVPPLPAVLFSLPDGPFQHREVNDFAAPEPAGDRRCIWTGALDAHAGPGQKLLHFVVLDPDELVMRTALGLDTRLTPAGHEQCRQLQRLTESLRPGLFITSPLTRTAETTLLSFGPQIQASGARIIALDDLRETVDYRCDARRARAELAADFPAIDFSGCAERDSMWAKYEGRHDRESADAPALAARARRALASLAARPEKELVIVTHKGFLWNTLSMGQPDGKFPEMPPVFDFGDDDVRRWMCSAFAECEVRSVLADFNPPPKRGAIGGKVMSTRFGV